MHGRSIGGDQTKGATPAVASLGRVTCLRPDSSEAALDAVVVEERERWRTGAIGELGTEVETQVEEGIVTLTGLGSAAGEPERGGTNQSISTPR
jgi:hypothetical protein